MSLRYVVPALAIAGRAVAQCSANGTTTIQNSGDATALASCETFTGSIAIATDAAGTIALDGIQTIEGSLIADGVDGLNSISASDLEEIEDTFQLNELTLLSTVSFPALSRVGSIDWNALPALTGVDFTSGLSEADSLIIQNTRLNSLDGINLEAIDTFNVVNNGFLQEIDMQLGNITTSFSVQNNGQQASVTLSNLIWAANMTFLNITDLSLPSLERLNGSLYVGASYFESISFPNLTQVDESLSFVSNEAVTNISMPSLTEIGGGFVIQNNTELTNIDGFDALETIGGALNFRGAFENITLPALESVEGGFTLLSTGDIQSICDNYSSLTGRNNVIRGRLSCEANVNQSVVENGNGTTSGSGSGSDDDDSAASTVFVSGGAALVSLMALFSLL